MNDNERFNREYDNFAKEPGFAAKAQHISEDPSVRVPEFRNYIVLRDILSENKQALLKLDPASTAYKNLSSKIDYDAKCSS